MATIRPRAWTTKDGKPRRGWQVDYKDDTGKRRHKQFERKKDADEYLRRVQRELEDGTHVVDSETRTFGEACQAWLDDCERRWRIKDGMAGNTLLNYRQTARINVLPVFGGVALTAMSTQRVQDFVNERCLTYKWRSVVRMITVINLTLKFAFKRRWLKRNPLKDEPVAGPRGRIYDKATPPPEQDLQVLWRTLARRNHREHNITWRNRVTIVTIALFTGMRRGEICGLQWDDVDFETCEIRVRHSLSAVDGLKGPKSRAGYRSVPMVEPVHRALAQHAERRGCTTGYVLVGENGKPLPPGTITSGYWQPLMRAAGLAKPNGAPGWSFHKLRHAATAFMIKQGLSAYHISKILGHSDVSFTLKTYGHLWPSDTSARSALANAAAQFPSLTPTLSYGPPVLGLDPSPAVSTPAIVTPVADEPVAVPSQSGGGESEGRAVFVESEPSSEIRCAPGGGSVSVTQRRQALQLWELGLSMPQIAARLDAPLSKVRHWVDRGEGPRVDRPPLAERRQEAIVLWNLGTPAPEIAVQLGTPVNSVYRWLREAGISRQGGPQTARRQEAIGLWKQNVKVAEIATQLGTTTVSVYRWLREAGISMQDGSRAARRQEAIALRDQGAKVAEIAAQLGAPARTIYGWLRAVGETGGAGPELNATWVQHGTAK